MSADWGARPGSWASARRSIADPNSSKRVLRLAQPIINILAGHGNIGTRFRSCRTSSSSLRNHVQQVLDDTGAGKEVTGRTESPARVGLPSCFDPFSANPPG
jgi:hypothetical protein